MRKASSITVVFITLINLYFLIDTRLCDYSGTNWKTVIYSDGKGYYEYLRAAFIEHNLSHQDPRLGFMGQTSSGPVIKYFAGTALAQSPFFAVAYFQSLLSGETLDGYSFNFQLMIAIAGWFYCSLGLFFLNRLFGVFHFKEWIRVIVLLLITYATSLFYYAILEPSMSHVYSFAAIATFLYTGYRYFETFRIKYLIAASAAFGLVILIRPTNGMIIFMLPFLCQRWQLLGNFLSRYSHVLLAVFILSGCVFVQMLFWHLQCGQWLVWPYTREGFYFTRPEIFNVLFSYRKGLFVYTPLTLISLAGLIPLFRINRIAFISIALTVVAAVYITSSWWDWNFGDSFGMRPLIDFYPLFAILLGVLLSEAGKSFRAILFIPLTFFFVLGIVQTYQYYHRILQHYSMDKDKYWYVFLKTNDRYRKVLGGNIDLIPYSKRPPVLINETKNDFERPHEKWHADFLADDPIHPGEKSCSFDQNEIGLFYAVPADSALKAADMLYVEASLRRYEFTEHSSSAAVLEASVENGKEHVYDYVFALNDYPDSDLRQWRTFHYVFAIPIPKEPFEYITIQIRNPAKQKFLIDDFKIRIYEVFQD